MHQPSGGMGGSASDIKIQAQQSLHIKKVLFRLISQHTGQPLEQVEHDADRDRWFTADQALEYGFIDKVVASAGQVADQGRPAREEVTRKGSGRRHEQHPHSAGLDRPAAARASTPRRDMNYYIPQWEERTSYGFRRIDPYAKLFEDRIIFLGTPISDDIANAVMAQLLCLESMDPDRDISDLHQQPRWLVHRADRDLRHDAVRQARHPDRLPGPGRLRGGDPARRGRPGQAAGAARTAGS